MRKMLEASRIWPLLTAISLWLDKQWEKSFISRLFREREVAPAGGSLVGGIAHAFHALLCGIFRLLRLDRAFEGSVFARTEFWVLLTMFAAPILPTMVVLGICLVGFASLCVTYGRDPDRRMPRTPLTKWLVAFALVYLVATFTSVNVAASFRGGILTAAFTLFGVFIPDVFRTRDRIERAFRVMVVSGTVVAVYGIFQALTGAENAAAWFDRSSFENIEMRVYSTLENPNVLSEFLLLMIPVGVAWVINAGEKRDRLAGAICTALMFLCLLLTFARGGYLGLAFAMALFLVLLDRRFIVLGVIGVLALLAVAPQSIIERLSSIGDMSDTSTTYRVYIWMAVMDLLRDNGLFGVGTGVAAFKAIYQRYSFNAVAAPHAHNLYLEITCECGIPGIVTLMGAVISYLRELGRAFRSGDRRLKIWSAAMLASMTGFLIQSLTEYSFYNYRVILVFWTFVGMGAALAGTRRGSE